MTQREGKQLSEAELEKALAFVDVAGVHEYAKQLRRHITWLTAELSMWKARESIAVKVAKSNGEIKESLDNEVGQLKDLVVDLTAKLTAAEAKVKVLELDVAEYANSEAYRLHAEHSHSNPFRDCGEYGCFMAKANLKKAQQALSREAKTATKQDNQKEVA